MDVLIQGVGWLLVAATIFVSVRQFAETNRRAARDARTARDRDRLVNAAQAVSGLVEELASLAEQPDLPPLAASARITKHTTRLQLANILLKPQSLADQVTDVIKAASSLSAAYGELSQGKTTTKEVVGLWLTCAATAQMTATALTAVAGSLTQGE